MQSKKYMNILFLNKLNGYWEKKFEELRNEFTKTEFTATFDPDERAEALSKADAVVCGRISEIEVNSSPMLKAIFVPFTGLNNFPLTLLGEKGIKIFNTHANAPYVAEHAVALALALLGRLSGFHDDLKKGKWNRSIEEDDMWVSMRGKRVGILGYGHIGRCIAELLVPYKVKVTGFKRYINKSNDELAELITDNFEHTVKNSDIIFNTLPLNPETKHIINAENIHIFKDKYLVTVGRGETISEDVLYNTLKENIIAGAAIDVWYNYPGKEPEPVMPAGKPFWELPNVLLSPHKSSHAIEAVNAMIDDTCNNIRKFLKGRI